MPLKAIIFFSILLLAGPPSLAEVADPLDNIFPCSTEKLNSVAEDFNNNPKGVYVQIDYGRCLVVHGFEAEGMRILHNASDNGAIPATYFIAKYIKTGGTLRGKTDRNSLDEALDKFFEVLILINMDSSYPNNGWAVYEYYAQMELDSIWEIPFLYGYKFQVGATNLENDYISNTTGSKYNNTIDSLKKMIKHADLCVATPNKAHFRPENYTLVKGQCGILQKEANLLLPLEKQRLDLLNKKTCSRSGLTECPEYKKLKDEMIDIIREATTQLYQIFDAYNPRLGKKRY